MRKFLLHYFLVSAVTFLLLAFGSSASAQQADQDPAPASPHQADPTAQQSQQNNDAQMPASGEATIHEAKTFSGSIVKENGGLVLKDPVTRVSYKLSNPPKATQYVGKQVKVTGKLDTNSNTIQVEVIEPLL